jgi:hypothetical protein
VSISILVSTFGNGGDIAASVGVNRTSVLALDHLDPVLGRVGCLNLIELVGHV